MKVYVVTDHRGDPLAVFESRKDAARWVKSRPWVMVWPMKLRKERR